MAVRFRGIRVRPYMRYMRGILGGILFLFFVSPIAYYAYKIQDKLIAVDYVSIAIVFSLFLFSLILAFFLSKMLIEQTVLFAKWDRFSRISRFLYEHRYFYEKKGANGKSKVKFPRIYLRQNKFDLEVAFELAGSKFQEKFKQIGGDLETTFAMDFMETEDDERFKTYRLAYSALLNRINGIDVSFSYDEGVKLMKNFAWDFLSDPHLLVSGGTGGGKTVFLSFLILCLAKNSVVEICDPKRADFVTLADVPAFKGRVSFEIEDIISKFEEAEKVMLERYDFMRSEMAKAGDKDLRKFYEYGLEPYFLICDEYNSFINSLDFRQRESVERSLIKLTLLGRQAGVNVILAMQKPTAEDIPTKVRDNMNMRIVVGRLSDLGYNMMFGEVNRNKEFKFMKFVGGMRIFGRGYSAVNGEVAREFYSPLLAKGFSFYNEFSKIERHENPFEPNREKLIIQENISSEEVERAFDFQKTLKEWAALSENNLRSAKRLIELLEESKKWSFSRDEKGEVVLGVEDEIILQKIFEKRATTGLKWREVVDTFDFESI